MLWGIFCCYVGSLQFSNVVNFVLFVKKLECEHLSSNQISVPDTFHLFFTYCGEPHIIRAQSNCTTYNGTWYNMTCWFEDQTEPDVYNNVQHLANISGAVDIKSPSDEYFQ